ncbi:hypothetical protein, partial [Mycobacterium avium]|uniref:hypothetical protein n=1 Tax=Mycobacterium avium TaxID=1764 RepID=UPI001F26E7B9
TGSIPQLFDARIRADPVAPSFSPILQWIQDISDIVAVVYRRQGTWLRVRWHRLRRVFSSLIVDELDTVISIITGNSVVAP